MFLSLKITNLDKLYTKLEQKKTLANFIKRVSLK